jgi:aminoglycoside phosphotransferase (APT) family kinase protein
MCYGEDGAVRATLDWELSTLGHPLSDLAYLTMGYHIEADGPGSRGVGGLDLAELGIPQEAEILERYCETSGRMLPAEWPVFQVLAFFRLSAILHSVMGRALQGNASNPNAMQVASRAGRLAAIGRSLASRAN